MTIVVEPGPWGNAIVENIAALLNNVADHFLRHFNAPPAGRIRVHCVPNEYPRTCFRNSPDEDYRINLPVQDRDWARFTYNFAHEFCHVLSGYERLRQPGNQWFHETICEVASLFALKQMAITWRSSPPYHNWSDYALCLDQYADRYITAAERQPPTGTALGEWFRANEGTLRADPVNRVLNDIAAGQLLPIFRQSPGHWQAVPFMPDTSAPFREFLSDWHRACPVQHRQSVTDVCLAFGHPTPG